MNRLLRIIPAFSCFAATAVMLAGGCAKKERDARFDPSSPSYQSPELTFTGVPDSIITIDTVSFSWEGNRNDAEFSWSVNGGDWSEWSGATGLAGLFDDGTATVDVRTRYEHGVDIVTGSVTFTVNALPDTALYLFPRQVTPNSDTVQLYLRIKGLDAYDVVETAFSGARLVKAETVSGSNRVQVLAEDSSVAVFATAPADLADEDGAVALLSFVIPSGRDTVTIGLERCGVAAVGGTVEDIGMAFRRGSVVVR